MPPSAGLHTLLAATLPVHCLTVTHHLKMFLRDMTDIAPRHLLLRKCLLALLQCPVTIVFVSHGTAAVVPELRRRHGGASVTDRGI